VKLKRKINSAKGPKIQKNENKPAKCQFKFFNSQGHYSCFTSCFIYLLFSMSNQISNCLSSNIIIIKRNRYENTKLPFKVDLKPFAFKDILIILQCF